MPKKIGDFKKEKAGGSKPEEKKKKKKRGFFGNVKHYGGKTAGGFYEMGTGLPSGMVEMAKVTAPMAGDIVSGQRGREVFRGKPILKKGEKSLYGALAKGVYTDLRHPLRNPASTLLTAGGIIAAPFSGGASLAPKVAAGTKAAKATGSVRKGVKAGRKIKRRPPVRYFEDIPEVPKSGKKGATHSMALPVTKKHPIVVSQQPFLRLLGSQVGERTYRASRTAEIKEPGSKKGAFARKRIERAKRDKERFTKQRSGDSQLTTPGKEPGKIKKTITFPTNLMRGGMLLTGRYHTQNTLGTSALLANQGPIKTARSVRQTRKMMKTKEGKETVEAMRQTGGTPRAESTLFETPTTDPLGRLVKKGMEKSGVIETKMRGIAMMNAARDLGHRTPAQMKKAMEPDHPDFPIIAKTGNDAVVDYSRMNATEKAAVRTQIPIFYPMFKGFARYGVQFPSKHPVKAAVYGQIGKEGKKRQREALGFLPHWAEGLVSTKGGKAVLNLQNLDPFSPVFQIGRGAVEPFRGGGPIAGASLAQFTGPTPNLAISALLGRNLSTGWELEGLRKKRKKGERKPSSVEEALKENLLTGGPIPFLQALAGKQRSAKVYEPMSKKQSAVHWGLGPGFVPRTLKNKGRPLRKMGKQERKR